MITVPSASVSDNVQSGVKTEVKVSFGMDEVTLNGNTFVAEKVGVYTITYTATDKAGNQTQEVVLITVKNPGKQIGTGEDPKEGGCGSVISGVSFVAVAALGAVVFIKKRKEN
jgi:hypothetical protein